MSRQEKVKEVNNNIMAIGGNSGYLTVNPTQDYIGQAARGVENGIAQVRAEKYQKERDQLASDRQEQQQRRSDFKDSQEINEKYPHAALGDTDMQNMVNFKTKYTEFQKNFIKTGSEKDNALAQKAMSNIVRITESKKAMSLKAEEMQKNRDGYNQTSFGRVTKLVDRVNKDVITRIDDNGDVVNDLVIRDGNNTIIGVEKKGITDAEIKKMLQIEPKYDVTGDKGLLDQFAKSIGKSVTIENVVDGKETKTTYTPGSEEVAKTMAIAATKDHSAVYSALEELGMDPENEDNYKGDALVKVQSLYENLMNKSAPKTEGSKENYDEQNYNLKVAGLAVSQQNATTNANNSKNTIANSNKNSETTTTSPALTITGKPILDKNGKPVMITRKSVTTKVDKKAAAATYTNITETDRGTIGVKNGKWYYTKTGKLAQ
jgi:hypothetical protein